MSLSSKFFPESRGEKNEKIGQYLAKIWKKYNSLLFGPPCHTSIKRRWNRETWQCCTWSEVEQKVSSTASINSTEYCQSDQYFADIFLAKRVSQFIRC